MFCTCYEPYFEADSYAKPLDGFYSNIAQSIQHLGVGGGGGGGAPVAPPPGSATDVHFNNIMEIFLYIRRRR